MDVPNTPEPSTIDFSTTEKIPTERSIDAITTEIERLQHEQFDNTASMVDSLLLNHSRCNSRYLNEMLAKIGPEFPTLDNTTLNEPAPSHCDIQLPATNVSRLASNFEVENCAEISPSKNGIGFVIQEVSTVSGEELVAIKKQLQQQQDMISELQQNNLAVESQVKQQHDHILQQHEMIYELRKQLNTLTEIHRRNVQTLSDDGQQPQQLEQTKVDEEPTTEVSDETQLEIADMNTVTTNDRTPQSDSVEMEQLKEIDIVPSPTQEWNDVEQYEKTEVVQSAHSTPSHQERSESDGSLQMKQFKVRSVRIRKGDGKQETESTEISRNSRRKDSKTYDCGECDKRFNRKSNLTQHLIIHGGEKPYQCKDCNAAFNRADNLKKHQRIHNGEKPYQCKDCNAAFSHAGYLKIHERIHNGEKHYQCKDCNAAFNQAGNLKIHQRIHNGEKPYQCKDCNVAFNRVDTLKRHQRIRNGEKPYQCKDCNVAFNQVGNLKKHQRIHTDEKPFICDICKASFRHKKSLSAHMDIHSGRKCHSCNVCRNEFRFKSSLLRHLKTHSIESPAQL